MIETHLNLFDASVLAVMALSCLFAFFRGFVREILSLGAWLGAGLVTIYFFPAMAEKLQPQFKSAVIAGGFATLGIYIAALLFFSMINMIILKYVKAGSDVGLLDNWLGLFFGAFRGAFIISLGFFLMTMVIDKEAYPEWLKKSLTRPYVEKGAEIVSHIAPNYLRDISSLTSKEEKEEEKQSEEKDEKKKDSPLRTLINKVKSEKTKKTEEE